MKAETRSSKESYLLFFNVARIHHIGHAINLYPARNKGETDHTYVPSSSFRKCWLRKPPRVIIRMEKFSYWYMPNMNKPFWFQVQPVEKYAAANLEITFKNAHTRKWWGRPDGSAPYTGRITTSGISIPSWIKFNFNSTYSLFVQLVERV